MVSIVYVNHGHPVGRSDQLIFRETLRFKPLKYVDCFIYLTFVLCRFRLALKLSLMKYSHEKQAVFITFSYSYMFAFDLEVIIT